MSSTTMNIAGSVFGFKLQVVFYRMPCLDDFFTDFFFKLEHEYFSLEKSCCSIHVALMKYQNMKLFQWRPPCMICNSRSVFKFNFATIELFHISLFCFLLSLNLVMNVVSLIIPTSLDQFEQVLTLSDNFGQIWIIPDKFGQVQKILCNSNLMMVAVSFFTIYIFHS